MKSKIPLCLVLAFAAVSASAQLITEADWKEVEVPPPPSFSTERLIPIEMPRYISSRLGVDPATISITKDGVVRYVVVARNASGSISGMYEGIRCAPGEVKTYARYSSSGQWSAVPDPQWHALSDNLPSKHALVLARQGVCEGRTPGGITPAAIINALKSSRLTN